MKLLQLLFLLFIIYLVCIFLYQITQNVMMYKKVEGTVTSCEKDTLSFTFTYKNKKYGPFKDNLGELDTCRVGDSHSVKINPLFPSSFTNGNEPIIDVLGMIFMTVAIVMIVGLYFLYRAIYGIEKGNWFVNSKETFSK
jgi:hypothetical protein